MKSIIAIHGLDTSSPGTWTAWKIPNKPNSGKVHWLKDPHMLPNEMPTARIFTYDWSASLVGPGVSQNRLADHARALLNSISGEREKTVRTWKIIPNEDYG